MNKMVLCAMSIIFIVACTNKKEEASDDENVKIVKSMFDAFNRHDWKAMADHYIDSASFLDPSFGKEYIHQSKTALAAKYAEMEKFLPDIQDNIVGLYPSGDKVTIEFVSTGTMPDSSKFSLPISCILTLKDGRIVKDATYYDLENP